MGKLYSEEARLVATAIDNGALDQDLKELRRRIDRRHRQHYSHYSQSWHDNDGSTPLALGQKWRFKEDKPLRYHPQYLKGAICKVVTGNSYRSNAFALEFIEFKRKPRGGFGAEPRYDVGSVLNWFYMEEIEPYDTEEAKKALEAQIDKIRQKHEATT